MNRTLLALLLVAIPTLCSGQSDAPIRRPEIRVGYSWTYRSTNMGAPGTREHENRVSFVDAKVILLVSTSKSDEKEIDSSWTAEWNAVTSYGGLMFRPHSGLFRFPLKIGAKHDVKYELLRPRMNAPDSSTTGSVTVVGWEAVEVPAGRFRAIRLDLDSMVRPSDGSRAFPRQVTFWYVPDVRRWVKLQGATPKNSFSEELLDYKLNED